MEIIGDVFPEERRGRATGSLMTGFALASVVALLTACLWDDRHAYALKGLYIAGLIAAGMAAAVSVEVPDRNLGQAIGRARPDMQSSIADG